MKSLTKWKALAFESELIAKDVLSKEFLSDELFQSYSKQVQRLKVEVEGLEALQSDPIRKNLEVIETRLRILNPEHRIQTNFEFFTRKISHFQSRLELLKESLEAFNAEYTNLSMHHVKRAAIEQEIALLESQLSDAVNQREALLA
ncbi:MAG: hypothetical protein KDK64_00455 [Chlamydiia bacterium]|nr:hypothetical protein [Chlamydiia bacterium]